MDAKLVATEADYTAVNAAFGKAIASVPSGLAMGVYSSFCKLVSGDAPRQAVHHSLKHRESRAAVMEL